MITIMCSIIDMFNINDNTIDSIIDVGIDAISTVTIVFWGRRAGREGPDTQACFFSMKCLGPETVDPENVDPVSVDIRLSSHESSSFRGMVVRTHRYGLGANVPGDTQTLPRI